MFLLLLESLILSLSVCIDTLATSFSYGASKIKIPLLSAFIINLICSTILGISLFIGTFLKLCIPMDSLSFISFILLFILGLIRLCDGLIKSYIVKYGHIHNKMSFLFFDLRFILGVYSSPKRADLDASKSLSVKEALTLSLALSLDGIFIGIGAALASIQSLITIVFTFVIGMFAVFFGSLAGKRIAEKVSIDFSWLSGIFLLILAFLKL